MEKKNGKKHTQTSTSTEKQLDEFAMKFKKDLSLVSFISNNTTTTRVWFLDNGTSHHMT
jgi:hypothetical protein